MDNLKSLQQQIAERSEKDSNKEKAEKEVQQNQAQQKEAQKKRGDYPEILRTELYGVIAVKEAGDYAEDLKDIQDKLSAIIASIPAKLITENSIKGLKEFFSMLIDSVMITGGWKKLSVETLVEYQLKARTVVNLLFSENELRQQTFDTCIGVNLGGRLSTLAFLVHEQSIKDVPLNDYTLKCKLAWESLVATVEEINAIGYITDDYTPYIFAWVDLEHKLWNERAHHDGKFPGDAVFSFATETWYAGSENEKSIWKPIRGLMVPRIESIKKLSAILTAMKLPKDAAKAIKDGRKDIFQGLMRNLEVFGVWTTNQCIDHSSRPHYLGDELTNAMMEVINQYQTISPITAACIITHQAHTNGPQMFYNCPEESMVNNGKVPAKALELLNHKIVKKVFKGKRSYAWISKQLRKLWKIVDRNVYWTEGYGRFNLVGSNVSMDYLAETWYKNLKNEKYWEDKKDNSARASA